MLSYGNNLCSGHVVQCGSGGWNWDIHLWNSGYEHLQCDGGGWGYQHESWVQDASTLSTTVADSAVAAGLRVSGVSVRTPTVYGSVPPKPESDLTDLRLAELKKLIDSDAKELRACKSSSPTGSGSDAVSEGRLPDEAAERNGEITQDRYDSESIIRVGADAASVATSAPAFPDPESEACTERSYRVQDDFAPITRHYGELPVRRGEILFVSGEPRNGWVFGSRRTPNPDEGWLPASALGLCRGAERGNANEEEAGPQSPASSEQPVPFTATERSERANGWPGPQQHEVSGGYGTRWEAKIHDNKRSERQRSWQPCEERKHSQQHLRPAEGKETHLQQENVRPLLSESAQNEMKNKDSMEVNRGSVGECGRGSGVVKGRGKQRGFAERPARERPALAALLDRLNKPLVVDPLSARVRM